MSIKPNIGYAVKSVRSFYSSLAETRNDDRILVRAVKLASHSYNDLVNLQDTSSYPPKKARATGGGRKEKAPEVR